MATDTNQTIQDSRRAAMSFLDAAKKKAEGRKNRNATFPSARGGGVRGDTKAVDSFLSAGQRNEARAAARQNGGGETDFDLADRIRTMSDEDFEKAMSDGTISPEQLRRAGEYDWDIYMGDVWMENPDNEEKFNPEPTYDEFIADPEKYGYTRGVNDETDRAFERYKRTVKKQE